MASVDTIVSVGTAGFAAVFALVLALTFAVKVETEATFSQTCDPGYPFLLALAQHTVNGAPFLEALSQAIVLNSTEVNGVNVADELEKFGESFRLIDSQGNIILSIGETRGRGAILAVPPGGQLVVMYER